MSRPRGVSASAIYPSRSPVNASPLSRVTSAPSLPGVDGSNGGPSSAYRARSRTVTGIAGSTISERDEDDLENFVNSYRPQPQSRANILGKKRVWALEGISKTRSEPPKKISTEDQTPDWEQTRECVARAAVSILGTTGEVAHDLLSISIHVLEYVPVPGLATAAKTLLTIWDALELVDMNRSACLRLTERCANTLLSIRSDVMEAGDAVNDELSAPIAKLVSSFNMIYAFLQKQIERPFLKRFLNRDDILRQLEQCDDELTNTISMFSLSVQIRILRHLQEFQRTVSCTTTNRRMSTSSQLTLLNGPPLLSHSLTEGHTLPPMRFPTPSNIPESQVLPTLRNLHSTQNVLDKERDIDALRKLMRDALAAGSDLEMMKVLQIERGDMSEAIGTLQRLLDRTTGPEIDQPSGADQPGPLGVGLENKDLDRRFIESGIDALRRMSRGTLAPLPNWAITRYEVEVDDRIGLGFFSDVYKGTWQGRSVAIKVLADSTLRQLFVREVEIWKDLDHENVLKLFGASSAQADPPHFFVSPYEKNGSLADYLKRMNLSSQLEAGAPVSSEASAEARPGMEDYDPFRYMHEIAKGMAYLHKNNVLHGDLKACNVLVGDGKRCVISDFGQSEMKTEVYRISGTPLPHGTLRWQAPELMSGENQQQLTPYMDVWSFAICCAEILNMGRMPWPLLDDDSVRWLVLSQDERPSLPDSEYNTPILQTLLSVCWSRRACFRPLFPVIVEEVTYIRAQAPNSGSASGSPALSSLGRMMWDWKGVTKVETHTPLSRIPSAEESISESSGSSHLDNNPSKMLRQESLSRSASFSILTQRRPVVSHRRTASSSSGIRMPEPQLYLNCFNAPSLPNGTLSLAPELSSPGGRYSPPPPSKDRKRGKRASISSLVTLPVQNASQVSLGAVGYYRGHQDFFTLFNGFHPEEAAMKAVRGLPSLYDYVEGGCPEKKSRVIQVLDSVMGFLGSDKPESPLCGSPGSRRRSLPPREQSIGPQTKYHYIENKEGAEKWLKDCETTIVRVFGPSHHIKKGQVKIVTGTYGQPDESTGLGLACISTSFSLGPDRGLGISDEVGSNSASPDIPQPGSSPRSSPIPIRASSSNRRWSRNAGGQF